MQARADAGEFPEGLGATLYSNRPDYFRVLQPHLADDAALDYVIDPRILGMAREATGGARIRYIEADCQIRRPNRLGGGYAHDLRRRTPSRNTRKLVAGAPRTIA
jgi:hypothetical protein